jgi:hypothetical protein
MMRKALTLAGGWFRHHKHVLILLVVLLVMVLLLLLLLLLLQKMMILMMSLTRHNLILMKLLHVLLPRKAHVAPTTPIAVTSSRCVCPAPHDAGAQQRSGIRSAAGRIA